MIIKWLGAGFGWALGVGPIYKILSLAAGYGMGSILDTFMEKNMEPTPERSTTENDFMLCIVLLASKVIKADGRVDRHELSYVRTFLADQFGANNVTNYLSLLEKVLPQDFDEAEVCKQINTNMSPELKLLMIQYMFGIANADYNISQKEIELIEKISGLLLLPKEDFITIQSMFVTRADSAYQTLGISPTASDEQVRAAFRTKAQQHHPDKFANLGESAIKAAEEKFRAIQNAYEKIKKERGL